MTTWCRCLFSTKQTNSIRARPTYETHHHQVVRPGAITRRRSMNTGPITVVPYNNAPMNVNAAPNRRRSVTHQLPPTLRHVIKSTSNLNAATFVDAENDLINTARDNQLRRQPLRAVNTVETSSPIEWNMGAFKTSTPFTRI
jgi:hypothetical protein